MRSGYIFSIFFRNAEIFVAQKYTLWYIYAIQRSHMTDEERIEQALMITTYVTEYLKLKLWNSNNDDRCLVCLGLITQLTYLLDISMDDKKVMNQTILEALKKGKQLSKQIEEEIRNV